LEENLNYPQSPIEKLNPHQQWFRFDSLPFEIQECIVKLILVARGDGLEPIIAREKMNMLYSMTDEQIIGAFSAYQS
jgi:hypothetical protein